MTLQISREEKLRANILVLIGPTSEQDPDSGRYLTQLRPAGNSPRADRCQEWLGLALLPRPRPGWGPESRLGQRLLGATRRHWSYSCSDRSSTLRHHEPLRTPVGRLSRGSLVFGQPDGPHPPQRGRRQGPGPARSQGRPPERPSALLTRRVVCLHRLLELPRGAATVAVWPQRS